MPNILDKIIANTRVEIESKQASLELDKLKQSVKPGDGSFLQALRKPALNIIAEIKPKSPSADNLINDFRIDDIVTVYNKYASAISVLTDEKYFGGSFELLAEVSKKVTCRPFAKILF